MLRRVLLIAKRDFIASVFTRAFLIGLVLAPLLAVGGFLGIAMMRVTQNAEQRRVAVVDRTRAGVGAVFIEFAKEINRPTVPIQGLAGKLADVTYTFEAEPADSANPEGQRLLLSDRVRDGELAMFVDIGPDAVHPRTDAEAAKVIIFSIGGGLDDSRGWITNAMNTSVRRLRLQEIGVDEARAKEVLKNVTVERMGLATRDAQGGSVEARPRNELEGFAVPFFLMLLMMMVVMGGAAPMLSVVAEDKMQRVFEMLLVSVTPFEILAGKVLASVGRSLTSSVFYIVGGILGLSGASMLGIVPFHVLPWFVVYVIAEVTMLSAFAAALGSAVTSSKDAQQFAMFLVLPIMLPAFMLVSLIQQPNGTLATAMSFIPPLTPMVMLLRQALPGGVPWWQPWVGLAGILLFTFFMTWAASRVFRIAILAQGKTPSLAELVRWAIRG